MSDTAVEELTPEVIEAQNAIRTGDIIRLTKVAEDAGEFTMRLLVEGEKTIDDRYFMDGAVEWRELPLPLLMKTGNKGEGHKEAEAIGSISTLWREGNEIWGSGSFASTPEGQKGRALIAEGVLNGVSADVGGASSEFEANEAGTGHVQRISKGIVTAATVLPIQAFHEARIAVTAAGPPVHPPAKYFEYPDFKQATPITVDGSHVFGHLATWDTCHIGISGRCQTAPRSQTNYAFFAHGEVEADNGQRFTTGKITLGTGHAAESLSAGAATEHYDNTGTAVADIVVGEDQHGIWFSGALRPGVTDEQIRTLRASAVSGDWRSLRGNLELTALLAVNTPGFPVPRLALVASASGEDEVVTLISASVAPEVKVVEMGEESCGCQHEELAADEPEDFREELTQLELSVLRSRVVPVRG